MKFAKKKVDLLVDQVFIKSNDLVIHESYCHLFYPLEVTQTPFIDTRIPTLNKRYTTYRTYKY